MFLSIKMKPGTARSLESRSPLPVKGRYQVRAQDVDVSGDTCSSQQTNNAEAKHGRLPDRGRLSKSGTARIGLLLVISPGSDPDLALSPSTPTPSQIRDAPSTVPASHRSHPHPCPGVQSGLWRIQQPCPTSSRRRGVSWICSPASSPERTTTRCGSGPLALVLGGGCG